MNDSLVQWQLVDESNGLVYPWLTHPMLDVLKTWDLSEKRILEFGGGRSSAWWRSKAKWVTTIEANHEWAYGIASECNRRNLYNGRVYHVGINEGDSQHKKLYTEAGKDLGPYDIVVVDGILRFECLEYALTLPRPLTVIADNWKQSFVWMSPPSEELMKPFKINIFEQADHTDNDGINKWKTVYWELK